MRARALMRDHDFGLSYWSARRSTRSARGGGPWFRAELPEPRKNYARMSFIFSGTSVSGSAPLNGTLVLRG